MPKSVRNPRQPPFAHGIVACNVNGIRAREAQLCEFIEREKSDIVCLQELKAEQAQIPVSCHLDDYHIVLRPN